MRNQQNDIPELPEDSIHEPTSSNPSPSKGLQKLQNDRLDKWGEPLSKIEARYGRELSELERHIVINVHSHSKCATGIWIEGEIEYIARMIESYLSTEKQRWAEELLEEAREYDVTDLERMDYHSKTPLKAVPVEVIEAYIQEDKGRI